jgi:hypothetical protein
MQTPRSSFFWISILVAIAPTKTGVISMDADVAAAMQLRVQSKVKMQVEREIHAETQAAAGLIHQSEARALLERAVYEAVADTREEEQAAARALVDREVTSVVLIRDAEAAAGDALVVSQPALLQVGQCGMGEQQLLGGEAARLIGCDIGSRAEERDLEAAAVCRCAASFCC